MSKPESTPPEPKRIELADGAGYEVYVEDNLIAVRLFDVTGEDGLIHFLPTQIDRFIAALSTARVKLSSPPGKGPTSPMLIGAVRRNFELLEELRKTAPAEVDRILALMVSHIRSWRPHAVLVASEAVL